jgi:multidrug transporter EmrE-like cation transporter
VAVLTFVLVLAPLAVFTWDVDGDAWKYIVPSGALELLYVALLATAYRHFDLSLVYPIARGLAPVATLVLAVAVVGAHPSCG